MHDGRDLMTTDSNRWLRVSQFVMDTGFSPCMRDASSCKMKWHQILPDYKRIADYHFHIGMNSVDYWQQAPGERLAGGLSRSFSQELFNQLHEWNTTRPHITPPHVRDLLAPNDSNYEVGTQDAQESEGKELEESVLGVEEQRFLVHAAYASSHETAPPSPLYCRVPPSKGPLTALCSPGASRGTPTAPSPA
jgi:hypothetical protein